MAILFIFWALTNKNIAYRFVGVYVHYFLIQKYDVGWNEWAIWVKNIKWVD